MIGVVKAQRVNTTLKKILHEIQENLFIIQANVASAMMGGKFKVPEFKKVKTKAIEKIIDGYEIKLKPARAFIIPGSDPISAWLDLLRAKSRMIERSVFKISRNKKGAREKRTTNAPTRIKNQLVINPDILSYLNRLSSLFFALARMEAKRAGKKEKHPSYR